MYHIKISLICQEEEHMVFYFSGTGNSQLVAVRIAEMTGDKAVSINRYMKKGEKAVFRSERPLVFVAPVYSWRLPRVVEQWIMENDLKAAAMLILY